ncbi:alpha/beta hydrolase [Saccharibacillus sp. CPCC 101409]|uniref:alpha/beta hydrolase n=1 Tax=Saccharibacillus sp. CPCC 101409 TaxID=3058041 RepID=UPI0026737ECA|nr:alpha/beta hydrolase [Saccharibacillus sp. CPCC 101409]MDO3408663.1 alpha/beta hydrolase [Saccharibacillus sp. CPCC 101409]
MNPVILWPDGAPNAAGTTDEDVPAIEAYLAEGENRAAVIVCPGGGYEFRADHEGEPIALWLNTLGISAFVLRYRVAPYRYPSALSDVQRAVRTVRYRAEEFKLDPSRIGVLGFSAGGHLASTAGTLYDAGRPDSEDPIERLSSRPDLLMLCYPVITLNEPYTHAGSRIALLGADADAKAIESLCSELNVTSDTPPTFLWHTSEDGLVPVENSLLFASALGRKGVPFDLHVYAHGGHGMGMAEGDPHVSHWSGQCASWLRVNGFAD